ncbi:hypothetical protein GCM10010149_74370 [Nonomuraea roseoviolacea subsp. roseoviolacea]
MVAVAAWAAGAVRARPAARDPARAAVAMSLRISSSDESVLLDATHVRKIRPSDLWRNTQSALVHISPLLR